MRIQDSSDPNFLEKIARLFQASLLFKIIVFLGYTFVLFYAGVFYYNSTLPDGSHQYYEGVHLRFNGSEFDSSVSKPVQLEIGISEKDYEKIFQQRNEAIAKGVLLTDTDPFVPAQIRVDDKKVRARLRLKGDWTEHLKGAKWSYRIHLKDNETLFGMKKFSLQHPKTRNFINEWLFLEAAKAEQLVALRYQFVQVFVNGKDLGIYALEEHFDKHLVENNQFREGPILKFNEDVLWQYRAEMSGFQYDEFATSPVEAFESKKTIKNEKLRKQYQKAMALLNEFRSGGLKTSDVFDVVKMAKFYALCDLWGAHHSIIYHNLRFYYNPVTARLEPVPFDANAAHHIKSIVSTHAFYHYDAFNQMLFSDSQFLEAYAKQVERMSQPEYLAAFLKEIEPEFQKQMNILFKEFSGYTFNDDFLKHNQKVMQLNVNPLQPILVYIADQTEDKIQLKIANTYPFPIEIQSLQQNGQEVYSLVKSKILPQSRYGKAVDYYDIDFDKVSDLNVLDGEDLNVVFQIPGMKRQREAIVLKDPAPSTIAVHDDIMRQSSNIDAFSYITKDEKNKTIVFKKGDWVLQQSLILPAGYKILIPSGTSFDLQQSTKMISYSPIHFAGTEEAPIKMFSSDRTGQGLLVLHATDWSLFQHVQFHNLSAPRDDQWALTGAVTLYESPVKIEDSLFAANHTSDDALNVIRAEFRLQDVVFKNTFADAIDVDFGRGSMRRVQFQNVGNDAVDFSGSKAFLENVSVFGAGDKGISVGEQSQVQMRDIAIHDAKIGFASKDYSLIQMKDIFIKNCPIGLTAYQKKPEYGPSQIFAQNVKNENVPKPYINEGGSFIQLHGAPLILANEILA